MSKLIFHIEDNPGDVILTRRALHKIDDSIEYTHVKNGLSGLEWLTKSENLPTIILLDINMPVMNGKEFLDAKLEDSRLKNIPVIILSTSDSDLDVNDCYDRFANGYVIKQYGYKAFVQSMQSIVDFWILNNRPSSY